MDSTTREIRELLRQAIPTQAVKRQSDESSNKRASFTDVMKVAHRVNRMYGRPYTIGCHCYSCQSQAKGHQLKAA